MGAVYDTSLGLINREDRVSTLLKLVQLQSKGEDVASVAVDIARYCLESTSVRDKGILSLSLELVSAQSDHSAWEIVTTCMANLLADPDERLVRIVLDKGKQLPVPVLRTFVLKGGHAAAGRAKDPSIRIRRDAASFAAAVCLRESSMVPPTSALQRGFTPNSDAALEKDPARLSAAVSALREVVIAGLTSEDDEILTEALRTAVQIFTASSNQPDDPQKTEAATMISALFSHVKIASSRALSMGERTKRSCVASLCELAGAILQAKAAEESRVEWAKKWLEGPCQTMLSGGSDALALAVAIGVAHICTSAADDHAEVCRKAELRVLPSLIRCATNGQLTFDQRGSAAKRAVILLSSLAGENIQSKTVVSSVAQLFTLCYSVSPTQERMRLLVMLGQMMFKLDCMDTADSNAPATKFVIESGYLNSLMETGPSRPAYPAEVVGSLCSCCFRMIRYVVGKRPNRTQVFESWFAAVSLILRGMFRALHWSGDGLELAFAKEQLLRLFELVSVVDSFFVRAGRPRNTDAQRVQQEIIALLGEQKVPRVKAMAILAACAYSGLDVIDSADNGKQILKALWGFLRDGYEDSRLATRRLKSGVIWQTYPLISTLQSDNAYPADVATRVLVQRAPVAASKTIEMLERYLEVLEGSRETDALAADLMRASIQVLQGYDRPNCPKKVEPKVLASFANAPKPDPLLFLVSLADSDYAPSLRLVPREMSIALSSFEALLLQDDGSSTFGGSASTKSFVRQGEKKLTLLSVDGIEVEATHLVDYTRKLLLVRLLLRNKTKEPLSSLHLRAEVAGAGLAVISPKSVLSYLPPACERLRGFTLSPVPNAQPGEGLLHISLTLTGPSGEDSFDCEPYPITYVDANFLVPPPKGVFSFGVWRRRWDVCPFAINTYVYLRADQTVDAVVNEMQKILFVEVGRLRSQTQFSALLCTSTSGAHVLAAIYAPEAERGPGNGPAIATVELRSTAPAVPPAVEQALRRRLISAGFRVLADREVRESEKAKPDGSFYVTDDRGLTIHQRWREAHRARMAV